MFVGNTGWWFFTSSYLLLTAALWLTSVLITTTRVEAQLAQWISPFVPVPGWKGSYETGVVYTQREVLNPQTGSVLDWTVNRGTNQVTFNFTTLLSSPADADANSTGGAFVVLGLSRKGNVEGADVVVVRLANLREDIDAAPQQQQGYTLLDMHGINNNTISRDTQQNWRLGGVVVLRDPTASGNDSAFIIMVTLSRDLDTCDMQHDIPINNDVVHLIWGSGTTNGTAVEETEDSMEFAPEGSVRAYIADPQIPIPQNSTQTQVLTWRLTRTYQLPFRHTSYWCNIMKGPSLPRRHHIIGYAAYFANATSESHVHHQLVYRCIAPPGVDPATIFQGFVDHPGEECYLERSHQLPTHLCTEIVHTWGVGGKRFIFPQNMGISIGETSNEYFMFESHYDNPEMRTDLVVENGVEFMYSPTIRPVEGGIIFIGAGVLGLYMVPPNSSNFTMGGLCSSECTMEMMGGVSGGGASIMATMLHSHSATNRMRMRHYRGGQELPWIQNDDNYDWSFQIIRHLDQPVKILPGDQVEVECTMDTTSRNRTTFSGFSTQDEMCVTFAVIDKRLGYLYCLSEYPTNMTLSRYGIRNVTWDRELQERVINQADNPSYVGQQLDEVLDSGLEQWTDERRMAVEREQLYSRHDSVCPPVRKMAMLAYAAYLADGLTKGLINLDERIESNRPSTITVSTPSLTVRSTEMPQPVNLYQTATQCTAQ